MEFACDRVQDATLASAAEWLGRPAGAPLASWLLVDAALIAVGRLSSLSNAAGFAYVNSLGRCPLAAFGDQAPQLLAVRDAGQALELVRGLMFPDRTAPAFSFFRSSASISDLQELFGYLALPQVEGGLELHCRFADTRVLASLLNTLSPAQALRVGALISEWCWFTRTSEIDRWFAADGEQPGADTPDPQPRARLTDQQFTSMLDAGEADTIFSSLIEKTPELVPEEFRGQFHLILQKYLDAATRRFVSQPNDRLQFVVLCLTVGEDFDRHPDLDATWRSIRKSEASLSELMKTWSDGLWNELEGLAEPTQ